MPARVPFLAPSPAPRLPTALASERTPVVLCPRQRTTLPLLVCRKQDSPLFPPRLRSLNMASFLCLLKWHVSCLRTGARSEKESIRASAHRTTDIGIHEKQSHHGYDASPHRPPAPAESAC